MKMLCRHCLSGSSNFGNGLVAYLRYISVGVHAAGISSNRSSQNSLDYPLIRTPKSLGGHSVPVQHALKLQGIRFQ